MDKICVIVPVYKVEKYIKRCVNSIVNQTYSFFDAYLVDDGSIDSCGEIIDEYLLQDDRMYAIHQKNAGLSAARNSGLDLMYAVSNAEWLSFIDSDDWVDLRYLEYLSKAASDTGLSISETKTNIAYKFDEVQTDIYYQCTEKPVKEAFIGEDGRMVSHAWGRLFTRKLFMNIRFPVGRYWEDIYTIYKVLFQVKNIAVVESPMYSYYQHQESIVNSPWNDTKLDLIYAYEEILPYFKALNDSELYYKVLNSYNLCLRGMYHILNTDTTLYNTKKITNKLIRNKFFRNFREIRKLSSLSNELKEQRPYFYILYPTVSLSIKKIKSILRKIFDH